MSWLKPAGTGAVIVTLLSTTAGFADVTPEQVWDGWQKGYQSYGYDVMVGNSDRSGDTLTVTDVKITNEMDDSSFTMTIPELKLRDRGDGTVEASMSEKMTGVASSDLPDQPAMSLDMVMTQTDSSIVVSGTPEDMIYAIDAPKVTVEMDQSGDAGDQSIPVKIWLAMENTTGTYEMKLGEAHDVTSAIKTGLVKFTASGADPEGGGTFNFDGQVSDVTYDGRFVLPNGVPMEKLDEALNAGANIQVALKYAASEYAMNVDSPDGPVSQKTTDSGGALDIGMSKEGIHFAGTSEGSKVQMTTKELPFPVNLALESANMDFAMPVSKGDADQDFKAKFALNGLTVSDDLWNMFDPGQNLPRDPATLRIDVTGKMTLSDDLFSPAVAAMPAPPMQVNSVDIKDVHLSVVGAELNGSGALEIQNDGPMPMPKGAIDLSLTGANALMDKLVAMGLVPQDQIMFGRMMLGLYAKPTGDDAYESKVEFKDGGEILVNGQRVQ
jgi:Uncharacterized protein conserved in bacteria (DUF2125).